VPVKRAIIEIAIANLTCKPETHAFWGFHARLRYLPSRSKASPVPSPRSAARKVAAISLSFRPRPIAGFGQCPWGRRAKRQPPLTKPATRNSDEGGGRRSFAAAPETGSDLVTYYWIHGVMSLFVAM
jgi:hypothetical protein